MDFTYAWLANMEGTRTMAKKVAGEHEKSKFWADYNSYQSIGEYGNHDWNAMAVAWNKFVGEREVTNNNDVIKYYRKHPHMLENFLESCGKSNNIKATLQPYQKSLDNLTRVHRHPVDAPVTVTSASEPEPLFGPNSGISENRGHIHMVSTLPLHMSTANALQIQKQGPLIYPGQTPPVIVDVSKKRTLDRAPQICSTCLHFRHHNILYKEMHYNRCVVPANFRSTENSVKGWCSCKECVEGAESVGYAKPANTNKSKRSLKTCTLCGHYKDHGYFKEIHMNKLCTSTAVPDKNRIKGYCFCEQCLMTAAAQSQVSKS